MGVCIMSAESKTRMTEGSISRKIILFAIPLFLGNLFQQLYNTVDSLIVGNFLGSNALAAVSSSGNLIFLMVGFINGIAMGAGVVIARYYGEKNHKKLQKAIHTTVAFGLAAGLILTVAGMYLAPKILVLMGTPSDVLPQSIAYFRTYFAGSLGFVMYNIFVGILQSIGDSRHPLIYLIVSSCINVVLDLFFRSWHGSRRSGACDSYFPVRKCDSLSDPSAEDERGVPSLYQQNPIRRQSAWRDYPKRCAVRFPKFGYLNRKRFRADKYQCIWKNGDGRLWFLCKNRGFCVSPGYMLYHGADHIRQPESWCKTV